MKFNRMEEIHEYIIFHPAIAERTADGGFIGANIEMTPYIESNMPNGRRIDDPIPEEAVGFELSIQHYYNRSYCIIRGQGKTLMEAYESLLRDIELFESTKEE